MKTKIKIKLFVLAITFLLLNCDKDVSVTPPEPPLPSGKIFVDSYPDKAMIFLNGRFTGSLTPDTINFIEKGNYTLLLKKANFKNVSQKITISTDSLYELFIDYRKLSGIVGSITVDSKPRGAEIFIDDSSTGLVTPNTLSNLFPGDHTLKLKRTGYWDFEVSIQVESGKTLYPYLSMVDSLVWVNYNPLNSGLPDLYINHTTIDNNNVKWISTLSKGLVSFDERNWTIYNTTNSLLPTNNINFVGVDTQNKKWICTQIGLFSFDGINWESFTTLNSGLPSDWISCIAFDLEGNKWIGTTGGVVKFDGINWTVYDETNSPLVSDFIEEITVDVEGNLWIGTANQGMAKFNGINWTIYNSRRTGFPKNVGGGIAIDHNGVLWIGVEFRNLNSGGVAFSIDQFSFTNWQNIPSSDVRAVVIDNQNNKWFANGDYGISKFDGSTWTKYLTSNSKIPDNRINSVCIDKLGYKWISTIGGGLSKYKGD